MNGADRFQLFFDITTRKVTGCGNVIRAKIIVNGIIPENLFQHLIKTNEAIRFLASLSSKRKWYSTVYKWKHKSNSDTDKIFRIHKNKNTDEEISKALAFDCELHSGSPIRFDVFYDDTKTHTLISVNHALLDYAGMENLLGSIAGHIKNLIFEKPLKVNDSFFKKFADAVSATFYVAARTSWSLRRLKKNNHQPTVAMHVVELSEEESVGVKKNLENEIKSTSLPFFVASAVFTLWKNQDLLTDKSGDFFIAVPIDRRPASHKNVLLANYLSFVYFHKPDVEIIDVKTLSASFSKQMIEQARKRMPEKFISFLELFRFLPPIIYWAWMNLPTKGHSASFAFSLLSNSSLENNSFMGFPVVDVVHYPPVISPPGLNIVFTEFREKLKIIISFDENRITKAQVEKFVIGLKKNLLN